MASRTRFAVLAGILIVINVAGWIWVRHEFVARGQPRIRVLSALPRRDVEKADRFTLLFDEPVAATELVGVRLDRSPFVVEPQPAGRWMWSQPDRLDFLLDRQLPPGRVYTVKAAPDLELQLGRRIVGRSEFVFQTRALDLVGCDLGPMDREYATVELAFNQPVAPADLLRHLIARAETQGPPLELQVLTQEPEERLVLRLPRPESRNILLTLGADLAGHEGQRSLGQEIRRDLTLPVRFSLLGASAGPRSLNHGATAHLRFSDDLDQSKPLPAVRVEPPIEGLQVGWSWDGLALEGPFVSGQHYTATVGPELLASGGQALGEEQSVSFDVPDCEPAVGFALDRGILSPEGNFQLDLRAVNVGGLRVRADRVHTNNLIPHVRGAETPATSRAVGEKTIPLALEPNAVTTLALDLHDLLGSTPGVYRIEADATDHPWTEDSTLVTVSDIGLTTKQGRSGYLVWVTSLRTAQPMVGAEVRAISYNNQVVATATTGDDGIAELNTNKGHPDGEPWMIVAQSGEDMNYLLPEESTWVLDGVDQSGRRPPETYDVMLYAERGAYRPGDTIHVTGLIRDAFGGVPPAFPLTVGVFRPDGRRIRDLSVSPDPKRQGFFYLDLPTEPDGQLGPYRFAATLPGAEPILGETSVLVEAFVPVRMEVTAETTRECFRAWEKPTILVNARYLFGQPAAALPVAMRGEYRRVSFRSKRFPDFDFTDAREAARSGFDAIERKLDEQGGDRVELPMPKSEVAGVWEAAIAVTVTEPGGRSVSTNVPVRVDAADRHVGLRPTGGKYVAAGPPNRIEWVQVTGADEPAEPGPMMMTLSRVEYDTTMEFLNQRPVWKSVERLIAVWTDEIPQGDEAAGSFDMVCPSAGAYRLVVTDCYSGGETRVDFHATADVYGTQTVAMDRTAQVEIVLDRPSYVPGDEARVLIRSPLAGTILLTLETDRVVARQVAELTEGTGELTMRVPENVRGGAFLTATVVRAIDPGSEDWLPHRAMGMARLATDHSPRRLPVEIEAPDKVLPGSKMAVTVRTDRPTDVTQPPYVHLWAVDEGILLTTAFDTPNPFSHFFAPREAVVDSADLFDDLLPDHKRPVSIARIGGDGGGEKGDSPTLRRSPVSTPVREPAVIWQCAMPVESDGTARFEMDMPDMSGEMRLMAVAADHDRYGTAARAVTLTAPLLVEASWPRFAAPGDQFKVPVKLFNSTDGPLTTAVSFEIEGPVTVVPVSLNDIIVEAGKPRTVWFEGRATEMGQVRVRTRAGAQTNEEPLDARATAMFAVRPASPPHVQSHLLQVQAGELLTIEPPRDFLSGHVRAAISVSGRPTVQLRPALEQVIGYPYGCLEQTTSRIYAMLHAPDLIAPSSDASAGDEIRATAVREMIDAGITRLWSMQTSSGGLAYWPGEPSPNLWATAYASAFLVKAKQQGHKVDPQFTDGLANYLLAELKRIEREKTDDDLQAMICWVLASFGRPQEGRMAHLSEIAETLDMAGRAELAAAWLVIGRRDRAAAVLLDGTMDQQVPRSTGGRITSQIRQEAVLLDVLIDLDPQHPWIVPLVKRLEEARRDGCWGTTLESATALAALARYQMLGPDESRFTGTLRLANGIERTFDQGATMNVEAPAPALPIEVTSSGTGNVYVSVVFEGLAAQEAVKPYDRQLTVRRRWLDTKGEPVTAAKFKVGDLVRVEVELQGVGLEGFRTLDNVAIVDALPAGMEVENQRLATSAQSDGDEPQGDRPDRAEFQDDRVVLFASAIAAPQVFRYDLRTITAGEFILPPIQASCMYDPDFASMHGGGRMVVSKDE